MGERDADQLVPFVRLDSLSAAWGCSSTGRLAETGHSPHRSPDTSVRGCVSSSTGEFLFDLA